MRPRLSENEALSGMLKLYNLTNEPVQTTKRKLSEECNLPVAKLTVLNQQGIIDYEFVYGDKHGRATQWVWKGSRPNIYMAKKLAETKPETNGKPEPPKEEKKEPPKCELRSSVEVHKILKITKTLNGESAAVVVEKSPGKAADVKAFAIEGEYSVDKLKCVGYAFLTAADELSRVD